MSLTRKQKENTVKTATDAISSATSSIFMSYDALNVTDVEELRAKLHEEGIGMRVIPKRLLKLVMADSKLEFDPTEHEGQMAMIWGDDVVAPAKIVQEFAKDRDNIQLLAGSMDGASIDAEQVQSLAKLPSREELVGKVVGTIAGPLRGLVSAMSGVPRNAVYVLQAIADQK